MKAAIYARVSTRDQSPDMQLEALRQYAKQRQFEIFDEYIDHGVSGAKSKRPELDRLMTDARRRLFDAFLVWRFDRFARSTKHLTDALQEFRSLGVNFISYQEAIDTSTPMGEAMFTIIGAMAQLERDIIRERVQAGVDRARAKGKRLGRPPIYADAGEVKRLREKGVSIRKIAKRLRLSPSKVQRVLKRVETPAGSEDLEIAQGLDS